MLPHCLIDDICLPVFENIYIVIIILLCLFIFYIFLNLFLVFFVYIWISGCYEQSAGNTTGLNSKSYSHVMIA